MSSDTGGADFPNNAGPEKVGGGLLNIDPEPETGSDEDGTKTAKFRVQFSNVFNLTKFIPELVGPLDTR